MGSELLIDSLTASCRSLELEVRDQGGDEASLGTHLVMPRTVREEVVLEQLLRIEKAEVRDLKSEVRSQAVRTVPSYLLLILTVACGRLILCFLPTVGN